MYAERHLFVKWYKAYKCTCINALMQVWTSQTFFLLTGKGGWRENLPAACCRTFIFHEKVVLKITDIFCNDIKVKR